MRACNLIGLKLLMDDITVEKVVLYIKTYLYHCGFDLSATYLLDN